MQSVGSAMSRRARETCIDAWRHALNAPRKRSLMEADAGALAFTAGAWSGESEVRLICRVPSKQNLGPGNTSRAPSPAQAAETSAPTAAATRFRPLFFA